MGSDSDGDDNESLATLVAVANAAFAKHIDTLLRRVLVLSRTMTAAVCDMPLTLLMREIYGSEGEHNPPRVKRTRCAFPRPTYKASSACALRCSGAENSCVYVRGRAIAVVDFFLRELR